MGAVIMRDCVLTAFVLDQQSLKRADISRPAARVPDWDLLIVSHAQLTGRRQWGRFVDAIVGCCSGERPFRAPAAHCAALA